MELLGADNIIKEKVNVLRELPDNYHPDLESKWQLLEAGLVERKQSFWKLGIVASLVLVALTGWISHSIFFKETKSSTLNTQIHSNKLAKTKDYLKPVLSIYSEQNHKHRKHKPVIESKLITTMPTIVKDSNIELITNQSKSLPVVEVAMKPHKRVFKQLDFGTPLPPDLKDNVIANNQPIFHLELFPSLKNKSVESEERTPSISISKSF